MNSNTSNISPKGFVKSLAIMHGAFTVAPFILSLIVLSMLKNYLLFKVDDVSVFYYTIPFIAIGLVYAGKHLFRTKLSQIKVDISLKQKLEHYQTASIIKYALVEGPAIICFVIALKTEQMVFLIIGWCILAYMTTLRPTKDKIIRDLKLNQNERNEVLK